jgi:hypothetical protein
LPIVQGSPLIDRLFQQHRPFSTVCCETSVQCKLPTCEGAIARSRCITLNWRLCRSATLKLRAMAGTTPPRPVRKNRVSPRFGKEPLLRPARRGILLLLRLMVADRASDRCSYQTMVAGEMSGDAANRCPFEAALGINRNACERQSHRQHCAAESRFHFNTSLRPLLHNPRRQFSFRLRRMGRSNNTQGPFQLCDRRTSSGKPDKAKDLGLGSRALAFAVQSFPSKTKISTIMRMRPSPPPP